MTWLPQLRCNHQGGHGISGPASTGRFASRTTGRMPRCSGPLLRTPSALRVSQQSTWHGLRAARHAFPLTYPRRSPGGFFLALWEALCPTRLGTTSGLRSRAAFPPREHILGASPPPVGLPARRPSPCPSTLRAWDPEGTISEPRQVMQRIYSGQRSPTSLLVLYY